MGPRSVSSSPPVSAVSPLPQPARIRAPADRTAAIWQVFITLFVFMSPPKSRCDTCVCVSLVGIHPFEASHMHTLYCHDRFDVTLRCLTDPCIVMPGALTIWLT